MTFTQKKFKYTVGNIIYRYGKKWRVVCIIPKSRGIVTKCQRIK